MAIDSSLLPSPTSDFPAEKTQTNQEARNHARKDHVTYKTKKIKFRGRKKKIILQNANGPCPLIAICNVLLLRNEMILYRDRFEVSQERLLSRVAELLIDLNSDVGSDGEEYIKNHQQNISDAINLLPRLADGINIDLKFRSINDFELTPELAIFDLLKIPLYHGWIVDPQDFETATAIGCKSYNALMTELVTLETQTAKAPSGQTSGEGSVDFAAAIIATLGAPSQRCSKTGSFADSRPASAEHNRLRRGDIEEELVLFQALRLSEMDTHRVSSSGGASVSGFSDEYQMSEDDTLVDSVDAESGCTSSPGSDICQQSKCDDQFTSKESEDETEEEVHSTSSITKSGALDHDQSSSTELGDETVCDVETENSSKMTDVDDDVPVYEVEKCVSLSSPVYEGESLLGQSSSEGKDTNGLTPREGEVINNFLNSNASQLTFPGLFLLEEGLKEGELCVFFRNNHFHTMLKYDNALYNLVTDQGYLNERDLVWEKLNQVNGESVFVSGDFKVFKCDSGKWDQQNAVSNTADYIFSINSSSKEGMEIDPDLKMAMELQQQELGGDIDFEAL